jgi:hypothetical protein
VTVENAGSICEGGLRAGDLACFGAEAYDPHHQPGHTMNYFLAVCRLRPTIVMSGHFFEVEEDSVPKQKGV